MILLSLVSTALLKVRLPFPIRPSAKPKSCDLGYNYEYTNTGASLEVERGSQNAEKQKDLPIPL